MWFEYWTSILKKRSVIILKKIIRIIDINHNKPLNSTDLSMDKQTRENNYFSIMNSH